MQNPFLNYDINIQKVPEYVQPNINLGNVFNDFPMNFDNNSFRDIPKQQESPKETITEEIKEKKEVEKQVDEVVEPPVTPSVKTQPYLSSKKLSKPEFKKQYYNDAVRVGKKLGIDPNIVLAQSYHESGGYTDKSLFGIKAQKNYKGTSQTYTTHEDYGKGKVKIKDQFRTYNNASEAFDDYANLISSKRYKNALGKNAEEYYSELKKGGYATEPKYVNLVMKLYNEMSKI